MGGFRWARINTRSFRDMRIKQGELEFTSLTDDMQHMYSDITGYFENLTEDRPMEAVLRQTISYIQSKRWALYE